MLNIFPEFLIPFLAPVLLRIAVGIIVLLTGTRLMKRGWEKRSIPHGFVGTIEAFAGGLLVIGLYTQAAALIILIDSLIRVFRPKKREDGHIASYYVLLAAAAFSLFLSGAGAFALDVPL